MIRALLDTIPPALCIAGAFLLVRTAPGRRAR